ncbi:hypothetical protein [Actinoplanes sp. HUAS TT8]|uniref:hypothetical protein n=1 Tax=Actinoplanes sp. HUAS TT8 TaxID=3447453 RepID=UPI003F52273D
MQVWMTPAGELLVEGPQESAETVGGHVLDQAGDPVLAPRTYYLLDTGWTLTRIFSGRTSSVDDSLYGAVCKVDGDTLYEFWTSWNTRRGEVESSWHDTEITGLVSVPLDEVTGWRTRAGTVEQALAAALADHERRRLAEASERQRPIDLLAARFVATLPDYSGDQPVDLIFGYDEGALVREPAGRVLWRLVEQWPYRGKDLHDFLRIQLGRHYGERLGSFVTDIDDAPWWFWAPDL